MDKEKAKKLEMRGWKIGDASDFLGLTQEESVYVDLKVALALKLRDQRKRKRLTQTALAQAIGSSQSRIAKMEAGDPTVSLDLLVKSLLTLGLTGKEIGETLIGGKNG
ncbi:MAG: helix-turn-helix domain-containing protein [Candidatus Omnitrophica bacterium]|nr:helix-turn-helix domain-containing protein [Candidatus Omnitrophota bacterium]MCA9426787.1 helix-turn-helix domain-containing protein [Candidatus Omnitrophota bacterium]MCA9429077.1 helix-turn-helix domain-containing protein [Candidatus Omnitrophota bacterium]MCA9447756.1 helix-turn-helix domain-containing protein [Candidatus Omnitrophota bacterium]